MKLLLAILLNALVFTSFAQNQKKIIYEADFQKPLAKSEWIIELQGQNNLSVFAENGKMILDSKGGVTVWLNKLLKGNFQIEYIRSVIMGGKANDRLSDLNQFWMALDPRNENLFTGRSGAFSQYDLLQLYYVGMGGNENTTTRFRKYNGQGEKKIIQENSDKDHLLNPNKEYHIKIVVQDGVTSFWVDGKCYFYYDDPAPLREGYFGFRSLHSRQEITDFKIYELQ